MTKNTVETFSASKIWLTYLYSYAENNLLYLQLLCDPATNIMYYIILICTYIHIYIVLLLYRPVSREIKKKKKGSYQGFSNLSCAGRKITNKHNANLTIPSHSLVENMWRFLMIQRREVWSHPSDKSKSITGKQGRAGGMKNNKTSYSC